MCIYNVQNNKQIHKKLTLTKTGYFFIRFCYYLNNKYVRNDKTYINYENIIIKKLHEQHT